MIPELGHFALILALLVALVQGVLPLIGAQRRDAVLMELAKPAARAQFFLVAMAFGCLAYSFATSDFSVANVAEHSNTQLPLRYRIAATWGSHEGSLLLWVLMLTGWSTAVTLRSRNLPAVLLARVLAVMGLVSVGFLLFLLLTSNPFLRLVPAAAEGADLNPLLQDPGMVIHPPMLYMGYVGFSVAFSFAIAALLGGRLDATWARWSRPWTTAAWSFLTIGIALGSWWSYYVLGWGGWWFWDPVENASFMPWLVGTALLHSLAVTEKRGTFKNWTVLLAIIAFSLSLLGTFLVRSGVLTSVHAFATDPTRGVFILAFLAVVIGGSLTLYAMRAGAVGGGAGFAMVSRESALLANNILLVVALGAVFLGTLYPMFLDALNLPKASVGPPYFNLVFPILMAPAVFLMGIGPIASWRHAELPHLAKRLKWAFVVAAVTAVLLPFTQGEWSPLVAFGLFLALWIIATSVAAVVQRLRHAPQRGLAREARRESRRVVRDVAGAPGDRDIHRGRDDGQGLRHRGERAARCRASGHRGRRAIHIPGRRAGDRPQLQGRGRNDRSSPGWQAPEDAEAGKARVQCVGHDDDGGCDQHGFPGRSLCVARRADHGQGRGRRVERARLCETVRRLDLVRLFLHGAGWLRRDDGPPLSPCRPTEAVRICRRGAGRVNP